MTILELAIVVGITALLASIAIPNFLEFRKRTQQSEAKSLLSQMYLLHQNFYTLHGKYYEDFRELGFRPQGPQNWNVQNDRRLLPPDYLSRSSDLYAPAIASRANTPHSCSTDFAGRVQCNPILVASWFYCRNFPSRCSMTTKGIAIPPGSNCIEVPNISDNRFTVGAYSNLDDDTDLEGWLINEQKTLSSSCLD